MWKKLAETERVEESALSDQIFFPFVTYMIDTLHSMIMSYNPIHDANDTTEVEDKWMVERPSHRSH